MKNLSKIQKIADFLADIFGCKSTLLDQSTKFKKTLVETDKRSFSANFLVNSTKYWRGTTRCFKGNSVQLFYEGLKFKKLDWAIFDLDSTNLSRIDVCYDRELNSTDRDPQLFLEHSCQTIPEKNDKRHARISEASKILWIGKRSSSNFFQIYLKLGMKKIRFDIEKGFCNNRSPTYVTYLFFFNILIHLNKELYLYNIDIKEMVYLII